MKVDTARIDKRELTEHLNAAYGLGITRLRFLPVGEEGYSYLATTVRGMRYFVKAHIAQNSKRAEILEGALRLTSWLHVDWGQTYVAAPYVTRDGAPCLHYGAFTVALFDYVDGLPAMDEPLPDLDWQRMATLLAALHRCAEALPPTLPVERDVFGLAYRPKLLRLLERTDGTYQPHTQIARQVHQLLTHPRAYAIRPYPPGRSRSRE